MTDARSPMRALRAAILAAVCVTLAAVGHSSVSAGSGHEIPPGVLTAAFAVLAGLSWLAGGRRRGLGFIAPAVLTAQGALHMTFSALGTHGAMPARNHGHPTGAGADMGESAGRGSVTAVLAAAGDTSPAMLTAHLLAGAGCALWLARGEAAFFRLARTVAAFAFTPLGLLLAAPRPLAVPPPVRPRHRTRAPHRPRGAVPAHAMSRRGPPAHRALPIRTTASGAATAMV
ncbi:hypothetical protein [Streptomyces sp. IB2014 016-6]|uniref:hypothetical protein n=1 Tax=Streptomyces sp. IB2014 016-6 TaxID=2517818 RepID=UPI0011C99B15|nr:hypothetical protein [Streptomyces sp. IB2014 016-6]TXL92791.1 hypothetical protein EW053_02145 [Streptomyces sp. IB2014 016-6]